MDVSNTIFVDAGTSVEQGIIGDPAAPFRTIDAAVRAGNAFRPIQEWTLEIVPGVYQMEMPLYIGYIFSGPVDDDIPIINIRTVQEWANLTFTNVRLVIDRIYTEEDRRRATVNILFDFTAEKGVDIHDDCYIDVIQTITPPIPSLPIIPFATLSGAVFQCSANSSIDLEGFNFTFLQNNIIPDPEINIKTSSVIALPATINIRGGTLLRNNNRNRSSISITPRKGTKYQSIIRSTERVSLGETVTSGVAISDPDRQYSMAFSNQAIVDNGAVVFGFIVAEETEEINQQVTRRRILDEVPEGPINTNLRSDIDSINETITTLARQYQDNDLATFVVLLESSIINDGEDSPLIEIDPSLDQFDFNPLLSSDTIICGFTLPNTERIAGKNCSILINNTQEGGSTLVSGSDLNAVTIIKEDYTHNYFDGKYFLVDATEGDITIKIPRQKSQLREKVRRKCKDEQPWQGRVLKYKRIDNTLNKVRIINQRGLIDNKHHHISLNNKKVECKCDKLCLAKKTLIVRFDGSAYTF